MKAALLIIDMQKDCYEKCKIKDEFDGAIDRINKAASLFRSKGLPVAVVQDEGVGGGPGHRGFEVVDTIKRAPTDIVIHKQYNNAFCKTALERLLKEQNVGFVVVSGYAAEYCVNFTLNGALECDFHASLLQNGVAGGSLEDIRRVQMLRPVVSLQALEFMLG